MAALPRPRRIYMRAHPGIFLCTEMFRPSALLEIVFALALAAAPASPAFAQSPPQRDAASLRAAAEEESSLREELAAAIKGFEAKHFPAGEDFPAADAELNKVYRRIMKAPRFEDYATQSKDGIRDTQRKWLVFRDRFTEFARAHYPATRKEVWLTWLTSKRSAQLGEVAGMVLPNNPR